jgi:hypothetical protein
MEASEGFGAPCSASSASPPPGCGAGGLWLVTGDWHLNLRGSALDLRTTMMSSGEDPGGSVNSNILVCHGC